MPGSRTGHGRSRSCAPLSSIIGGLEFVRRERQQHTRQRQRRNERQRRRRQAPGSDSERNLREPRPGWRQAGVLHTEQPDHRYPDQRSIGGSESDSKYEPIDSTFTHLLAMRRILVEAGGLATRPAIASPTEHRHKPRSITSRLIALARPDYLSMRAGPGSTPNRGSDKTCSAWAGTG